MEDEAKTNDMEQQKIELVKLRIKNKYYENEQVLENVVHEILKNSIKNDPEP